MVSEADVAGEGDGTDSASSGSEERNNENRREADGKPSLLEEGNDAAMRGSRKMLGELLVSSFFGSDVVETAAEMEGDEGTEGCADEAEEALEAEGDEAEEAEDKAASGVGD